MDFLKLLDELQGDGAIGALSSTLGAKPESVKQATSIGMPMLLQAISGNAKTDEGAASLAGALDQHSGADLGDLLGFLGNVDKEDGAKILGHILGGKQESVQGNLAKQTGISNAQAGSLLTSLAPLLLGALGNKKKEDGLDVSGVASMLPSLLGSVNQGGNSDMLKMATKLLDSNKDGSIVDDVMKMVGKFLKK